MCFASARLVAYVLSTADPVAGAPSKKQAREGMPQPGPHNPYVNLGVGALGSALSRADRCHASRPCKIAGENVSKGSAREADTIAEDSSCLDEGSLGRTGGPAVERRGFHDAKGPAGRADDGHLAAVQTCSSLPTMGNLSGRGGAEEARAPTVASGSSFLVPSTAVGSLTGTSDTHRSLVCSRLRFADNAKASANNSITCGDAEKGWVTKKGTNTVNPQLTPKPVAVCLRVPASADSYPASGRGEPAHVPAAKRASVELNESERAGRAAADDVCAAGVPHYSGAARGTWLRAAKGAVRQATVVTSAAQASCTVADETEGAEPAQTLSDGHGSVDDTGSSPPQQSFEVGRQQLYENARAGMGVGRRGRGRGRRGLRGVGRGGKRKSTAPVPAQGALLGGWRKERGKKGEKPKL